MYFITWSDLLNNLIQSVPFAKEETETQRGKGIGRGHVTYQWQCRAYMIFLLMPPVENRTWMLLLIIGQERVLPHCLCKALTQPDSRYTGSRMPRTSAPLHIRTPPVGGRSKFPTQFSRSYPSCQPSCLPATYPQRCGQASLGSIGCCWVSISPTRLGRPPLRSLNNKWVWRKL